jgi:hypothetical protein
MNSILTDDLREKFFIRLYFDDRKNLYDAGIKRAFLDFSRTLTIKENRAILKSNAEKIILEQLTKATVIEFKNQTEFDKFHETTCEQLIKVWSQLTIGQAQKWINMTLKYWLLFGNKRINGIEKNARFFHIPIDRYVQKEMFSEISHQPWSKIHNYETYFNYQEQHRKKKSGNFPIIDEFIFFNNHKPK